MLLKNITMGKYREPIGTYFNFDMHRCRTDFQEENIEISRSLIAFGRANDEP
jgi:hypothetical protein